MSVAEIMDAIKELLPELLYGAEAKRIAEIEDMIFTYGDDRYDQGYIQSTRDRGVTCTTRRARPGAPEVF